MGGVCLGSGEAVRVVSRSVLVTYFLALLFSLMQLQSSVSPEIN